jgi:tryptophan 7-halogenase
MNDAAHRSITIIGGGTAGWMAAAALARFMGRGWTITLVESDAIGTVGVGEATIPQIHHFNRMLGIDEADFVRETKGSFKLGIAFEGWRAPGHRYMHAFGQIGRDLGLLPFYQYWLRAQARGIEADEDSLDAYSIAAQAGYAGRFARPDPAKPAAAGGHAYAFHFDAGLYAAYLRRLAEAGGVVRVEGKIACAARHAESGDIAAVTLEDGRSVSGELFIDCSGFRGLLIEEALGAGYESWQQWLPCDRALAVPCAHGGPPVPYTRSIAREAGWQWQIPLQHRVGNGYVYSSSHINDDDAAVALLANLPGAPLAEPRPLRFTAGRRKVVWAHNVIAIGLSSGFLEPLESTSIHMIQSGIERLLLRLPSPTPSDTDRAAFNADAALEIERIRDFIILHYAANGRDEPFWAERRAAPLPDSLATRIDLFRSSGRIDRGERDLFTELAWQQVMIGQGIIPECWHPLTNQVSDGDLAGFLATARRAVAGSVAAMPTHSDFIAAHITAQAAHGEERRLAS